MLSFRMLAARQPRRSPDLFPAWPLFPTRYLLTPFIATDPKKRLSSPIIATLPKSPFVTPMFATHPRPPGWLTLDVPTSKHLGIPNLQTCQQSNVPTIYPLSFHILANSFACFCICAKVNPFRFKRFRTLCPKHRGATPNVPTFNLQTFPRPIAAKRLWCNNPQRHAISSRSGKQLRSSRCLRIRERTMQV